MKVKIGSHTADVTAEFADLLKTEDSEAGLEPFTDDLSHPTPPVLDPVGTFFEKAAKQAKGATTSTGDFDLLKALSETDSRDKQPSDISLRKNGTPDWSWSTPVSANTPLSKRATQGTKARFERQLQEFFVGDPEELAEKIQEAQELAHEIATELATA